MCIYTPACIYGTCIWHILGRRSKREVSKFGIRGIYALIENDIWLREDVEWARVSFERQEIKEV